MEENFPPSNELCLLWAWNSPFVILLWISTVIDWYVAKGIATSLTQRRKKFFLLISLSSNLSLLGFFKYGNFILANGRWTAGLFGFEQDWKDLDIILSVGISFYTFQTLSYTLDIYRGHLKPAKSMVDFALYVTFFPQLVAGPIVRAIDFIPQCVEPKTYWKANLKLMTTSSAENSIQYFVRTFFQH